MMTSTSIERVDELIRQSDRVYDTIDPFSDGEARYRRMLRTGINATALALRQGSTLSETGEQLLTLPAILPRKPGSLDYLADRYADVPRATLDRTGNPETDARHAIHLMKLAVPYAQEFYPHLDGRKVGVYALIHDLIEAYAGDVPSLGMSKEQEAKKHHDETQAVMTLRKEYGDMWPEFVELIEAYENLTESEARFTKTFDKLDPGFTHFYSRGKQIKAHYGYSKTEFLEAIDGATKRMAHYAGDFPQLMQDREELTRRVARVAFQKAA